MNAKFCRRISVSTIHLLMLFLVFTNTLLAAELVNKLDPTENDLLITMLKVKQGDAILIELPDGRKILVDTAKKKKGKKVVYPFLKEKKIDFLDLMVITHNHTDHIGGAGYIIDRMNIGEIWNVGREKDSKHYRRYKEAQLKAQVPERVPTVGNIFSFGDVQLHILHVNGDFEEENDWSIVFKLVYKDFTMLFAGDIEIEAQTEIVKRFGSTLNSDVYKVAHHGSKKFTEEFINEVHPKVAVCSGKEIWSFPSKKLISDLEKMGSKFYLTDSHGNISIRSDGDKFLVK